jgi:orotate phosphoribosyltransferase
MHRTELAKRLRTVSLLRGRFKLRSGKTSSFYLDKYRFESDPLLLRAVVDEMKKLLPASFDKFAGMELSAIPLATELSQRTMKPYLFVRKAAKEYGTCNLVEGGFRPGETIVVVEDAITVAGQVRASVRQLRKLELQIQNVICVIDRQQGGRQNLEQIDCSLTSISTIDELGPLESRNDLRGGE